MSADTGKTIAMPERAFFNAHPISGILEEGTDGTEYLRADLAQSQIDAARAGGVREGLERAAWLPMESAPRDGTLILLMGYPYQVPAVGMWESVAGVSGWSTDHLPDDLSGDGAFQGWLPIPPIRAELERLESGKARSELENDAEGYLAQLENMAIKLGYNSVISALSYLDSIAHQPEPAPEAPAVRMDDVVILIGQLVCALKKASPGNELAGKALDYLRRHDLVGSPLRERAPEDRP